MDCKTKFGFFILTLHLISVVSLISQLFSYYRVPIPTTSQIVVKIEPVTL